MNQPKHLVWIVAAAAAGFVSSFIFGDLITLPVDLYYLIYFLIVAALFATYVRVTKLDVGKWVSRRWVWAVISGVAVGVVMVLNVLSRPATPGYSGLTLAGLIIWRGLLYGAADGLLLYSFPWIVTWRAFNVEQKPLPKKIGYSLLSVVFVILITTTYHLGYSDFRSKKVIQPNIGGLIMSVPTLVTANPIAAPITHMMMHVTAVVHSPQTELFLPPHRGSR